MNAQGITPVVVQIINLPRENFNASGFDAIKKSLPLMFFYSIIGSEYL